MELGAEFVQFFDIEPTSLNSGLILAGLGGALPARVANSPQPRRWESAVDALVIVWDESALDAESRVIFPANFGSAAQSTAVPVFLLVRGGLGDLRRVRQTSLRYGPVRKGYVLRSPDDLAVDQPRRISRCSRSCSRRRRAPRPPKCCF